MRKLVKKHVRRIMIVFALLIIISTFFAGCSSGGFIAKFSSDVNTYNISIDLDEINKTAQVKQSTIYVNNSQTALDNICFHLYANSFREGVTYKPVSVLYESKAYPNGKSYGGIDITSVRLNNLEAQTTLEGDDNTILNVALKDELYPSESVVIDFEYSLTIPNINHRFGYGDSVINLCNFYPIACVRDKQDFNKSEYHYNGDPFYSDMANYNVEITTFETYSVATTGNVVSCTTNDHETTTKLEAKAVRDFAIAVSDKFEVLSQKVGNTTVNYYYYNDTNPQTSLQTAVDSLQTFNSLIGEYPYQTLQVVESNFVHGGMEYPNLVLISDCLEKYEDYQNTIIHEIAHQWWYGVVGNNEYDYGWLDEGLTEYTTALFYEQNPSYNLSYDEIMKNANSSYCLFVEVYGDIFGSVDTTMDRKLNEFKTEPEYIYISYVKGTLLFDSLREVLGKKTFNKCLKAYFKTCQGTNATPQDLINVFQSTSLRDLEGFFNSWINGTVVVIPKETPQSSSL